MMGEDIVHDLNQGGSEVGVTAFREFMLRMDRCYRERLEDLVLFANKDGTRAAAEFNVHGEYLATDEGLPEAKGQTYVLPAGAFFRIEDGKIARVTMYYNLSEWLRQVGA
ncbi:MAG: isopropylmalate/homocitrate/citramalate synthase [Verrucomicrobiales bacterium VVV1]|nr:MAG: isopropylmalate/homocitrate/citramalate synthase [Verrucomicrobiales bacterium VVV1]